MDSLRRFFVLLPRPETYQDLQRLGSYLTKFNKLTIFHTFILSNFNFCPLAWHFCTEKNSKKLEKIQVRALRFVYDDAIYTPNAYEVICRVARMAE
jgi:hypothetical protein